MHNQGKSTTYTSTLTQVQIEPKPGEQVNKYNQKLIKQMKLNAKKEKNLNYTVTADTFVDSGPLVSLLTFTIGNNGHLHLSFLHLSLLTEFTWAWLHKAKTEYKRLHHSHSYKQQSEEELENMFSYFFRNNKEIILYKHNIIIIYYINENRAFHCSTTAFRSDNSCS